MSPHDHESAQSPDGKPLKAKILTVSDGVVGVILDCRGRPLAPQLEPEHSYARMRAWLGAGDA